MAIFNSYVKSPEGKWSNMEHHGFTIFMFVNYPRKVNQWFLKTGNQKTGNGSNRSWQSNFCDFAGAGSHQNGKLGRGQATCNLAKSDFYMQLAKPLRVTMYVTTPRAPGCPFFNFFQYPLKKFSSAVRSYCAFHSFNSPPFELGELTLVGGQSWNQCPRNSSQETEVALVNSLPERFRMQLHEDDGDSYCVASRGIGRG